MGIFNYEYEVITAIPPAKIFKACILDGQNLIPKIVPDQAFKSVEFIQGNGEPGTVKKITFAEGSRFDYMVEEVEALDKDELVYCYSVIEGGVLMNKLEKITYESVFEASPDGGSVCKIRCMYHTIGDFEITEEGTKAGKKKALEILKAVEAYLLDNPDHC
ncbi:Major pollen allergen Bet v 1-M/N [Hibiscus syriacus]|uniref:Major pollen allergen Bet v 1-M/N n=1 Tax=Hibiscus syriacus TaxID=106335 RepID=A0A6A3CPX0_HIBSY|nr:major strawberry allergen Fra a 1.05-like [Hibiscus syriacus]KAE8730946.1 Major pollen allergen Bet v 1-M/N [Hibiscus syriacus]